jgi:hypothetical protein
MTDERLQAWFKGELEDDELTDNEVLALEERVFDAVARKVLSTPGVHTFPEHGTLQ